MKIQSHGYMVDQEFINSWTYFEAACHGLSIEKGWWESNRNDGEMIALMHSELSEALEGLRAGDPESDKIHGFSSVEEELADVIIRIADFSCARNLRLGQAIQAKFAYNTTRAHKHGGKKF
jgi:NTP pyrophosphatase (non-canonical NTP hydrolase)